MTVATKNSPPQMYDKAFDVEAASLKSSEVRPPVNVAALLTRLVNPVYFAESTRQSGYKGTTNALAELVDNSLQAKAKEVHIHFEEHDDDPNDIWVYIVDDGIGMNAETLALAPQFGGTSRFDDRNGMGRFGMGLPNASVSQARRFEVYSRQSGGPLLTCLLDYDQLEGKEDLEEGFMSPVVAHRWPLPAALVGKFDPSGSGTMVIWKKCDRVDPKNIDALKRKVTGYIGQTFRNFIYPINGVPAHLITVNGTAVRPFDPLYLNPDAEWTGGEKRGESTLVLPVLGNDGETSTINVRYSILPIEEWQALPPKEKKARRITDNKGFSVVRAGREIEVVERFFLRTTNDGEGRISNNDAWWGCEVSFDPKLDEVFGITNNKQEVRPNLQALQKLREEISATITTLRNEYDERRLKKTPAKTHPSEEKASQNDRFLPPLPEPEPDPEQYKQILDDYVTNFRREDESAEGAKQRVESKLFTIELESAKEGPFYRTAYLGQNTIVYVNTDHGFYKDLYSAVEDNPDGRQAVEMLLFALARGERMAGPQGQSWYVNQRNVWSGVLKTYLGN